MDSLTFSDGRAPGLVENPRANGGFVVQDIQQFGAKVIYGEKSENLLDSGMGFFGSNLMASFFFRWITNLFAPKAYTSFFLWGR